MAVFRVGIMARTIRDLGLVELARALAATEAAVGRESQSARALRSELERREHDSRRVSISLSATDTKARGGKK
jgi:hypothetical protein